MKVDKSLQEVWDWKDKVYKETRNSSIKETMRNIHKGAEDFCRKYGLKIRTLHPAGK